METSMDFSAFQIPIQFKRRPISILKNRLLCRLIAFKVLVFETKQRWHIKMDFTNRRKNINVDDDNRKIHIQIY